MIPVIRRFLAKILMLVSRKVWELASRISPDPTQVPWFVESGYDRYKRW